MHLSVITLHSRSVCSHLASMMPGYKTEAFLWAPFVWLCQTKQALWSHQIVLKDILMGFSKSFLASNGALIANIIGTLEVYSCLWKPERCLAPCSISSVRFRAGLCLYREEMKTSESPRSAAFSLSRAPLWMIFFFSLPCLVMACLNSHL